MIDVDQVTKQFQPRTMPITALVRRDTIGFIFRFQSAANVELP